MEPLVRVELNEGWRTLVLNRPNRMNSLTEALHLALSAALDAAEADPACRALLLTGAGRGFCAGQDLNDPMATGPDADLGAMLDRFYNPLIRRLRAIPIPVVCAVKGVAAGAGANLALACDIVLAGRSAKFIQAFARIGLLPDVGGTFFLPRLVGEARARGLALLAEPLPAETAEAWGLIWRAVDDDRLMPEAEALTAGLATQPTQALALTKRALAASAANTLDVQLDLERDLQRRLGSTPDFAEGVRAFHEKRTPFFTGKSE